MLCAWCRALLPGEVPLGLLDAFSPASPAARAGAAESALALAQRSPEALLAYETTSREIADLERRSRRNRVRAWALGLTTSLFGAMGLFALSGGAEEPATLFFSMGGMSGAGALATSRRGRRQRRDAEDNRRRQRHLQILELARAHAGRLNVTLLATHLALPLTEAEELLDSMVDGRRVDVQVDDQGRVAYVFPELTG
jgi:hypothetical protein